MPTKINILADTLSKADQLRQLADVIEGGTVKAEIHTTFERTGRVKWEIDIDYQVDDVERMTA